MVYWHHFWYHTYRCHHHSDAVVIFAIHHLCPIKDTANTSPKQPKEPTSFQTVTNNHNNQLLGAFIGTIGTQLSHHHCHHGNAAPLSDAGATLLDPKPGNGTNNPGGL
eukprot:5021914-Ditylum_brightwellii.AAC.2